MSDAERRRRAEQRRGRLALRKGHLRAVEVDLDPVRGEAALSLVDRLTLESWALSGRPLPGYDRAATPWRFVPGRPT